MRCQLYNWHRADIHTNSYFAYGFIQILNTNTFQIYGGVNINNDFYTQYRSHRSRLNLLCLSII